MTSLVGNLSSFCFALDLFLGPLIICVFSLQKTTGFTNIVQGQKPNQLVFFLQSYNSAEIRKFTIIVEYSETLWQDLCVYDAACGKTVNELLLPKINFDPTVGPFMFDSLVRYQLLI
jgi:hypothetical protein